MPAQPQPRQQAPVAPKQQQDTSDSGGTIGSPPSLPSSASAQELEMLASHLQESPQGMLTGLKGPQHMPGLEGPGACLPRPFSLGDLHELELPAGLGGLEEDDEAMGGGGVFSAQELRGGRGAR
jgi:hypothetical protein